MKLMLVFAAVMAFALGQEWDADVDSHYPWYVAQSHDRQRRQIDFDPKTGDIVGQQKVGNNGKIFGRVGAGEDMLFGKAGYEQTLMNQNNRKLDGRVYGTRVLTPYGNGNIVGGGLTYTDPHTRATFDANKALGGRTTYDAAAGLHWPIGKNGQVGAEGTWSKTEGMRSNYGGQAVLRYNF